MSPATATTSNASEPLTVVVHVPPELRAELERMADSQRTLTEAAAMGVEAALREHFAYLQRRPRQDGLQSTGFWSGVDGRSVAEQIAGHVLADDGSATVSIDSPELAHKLSGGTIRAEDYGHRYLTIPATDEAAQSLLGARGFAAALHWVEHPDGGVRPALIAAAASPRGLRGEDRREPTASDVLYWLVRQVTHAPMPSAMPEEAALADAARDAVEDALDALLSQPPGVAA